MTDWRSRPSAKNSRFLMSDPIIESSQKAQTLLPKERARLTKLLLDSTHSGSSRFVEDAWDEELQRRIDEVDRGVAALVSADIRLQRFVAQSSEQTK